MERLAFGLVFLFAAVLTVAFYIIIFHQLFLDHGKVIFVPGNLQSIADGLQMEKLCTGFFHEGGERLVGPFELSVTIKIFLCIFHGVKLRIQRNGDLLPVIIVDAGQLLLPRLRLVTVGVEQLSVNLIFLFFISI